MASHKLLLLPGDGIGTEVMAEVKRVIDWLGKRGIAFLCGQLEQFRKILDLLLQILNRLDDRLESAELSDYRLGPFLVVPETGRGHLIAQFLQLRLLARQVKASPGSFRPGPQARR